MEAGCLEWCVVIGLILREASVIKQVIGFLDSPEVPQETVQSVRSGLLAVDTWASTDWWVQHMHALLDVHSSISLSISSNLFILLVRDTMQYLLP